jgi:hypothetical protein
MHIAVRQYDGVRNAKQLDQHFRQDFVPLIKAIRGNVAYYLADAGNGTVFTVSIFEDAAGAQESTKVAADWVKQHPGVLPTATRVMSGEVIGQTTRQTA